MDKNVYLDYAATTPVAPEVVEAMQPYFSEIYGNASSPHHIGRKARVALEEARGTVAEYLACKSEEIIFTSGGTESNNLAIFGVAYALKEKGNHIIASSIEHHSVLEPLKFLGKNGFRVTLVPVDHNGLVDPDDVESAITPETILVSIMHANNEIGTIEPIKEIAEVAHKHGVYVHTDAVQTLCHLDFCACGRGIDLLSFSAHKFYGPKGVGGLYVRNGILLEPFLRGGAQERGLRASTHNVAGIVGMAKAIELRKRKIMTETNAQILLRDMFISGIMKRIDGVTLNGHPTQRLPNNINISIAGADAEALVIHLDTLGIACSAGSACTSGSFEPSHVSLALGLLRQSAAEAVRFSLGVQTTQDDIDYCLEVFPEAVKRVRALRNEKAGSSA